MDGWLTDRLVLPTGGESQLSSRASLQRIDVIVAPSSERRAQQMTEGWYDGEKERKVRFDFFSSYKWCRYLVRWVRVRVGGSVRVRVNG